MRWGKAWSKENQMDDDRAEEKESRLVLRAMEPEDVDFICRMENEGMDDGYSERVAPLSRHDALRCVAECDPDPFASGQLRLVIEEGKEVSAKSDSSEPGHAEERRVEGVRVGLLDFYDISHYHRRAMLGIIIAPESRGRGLGLRALKTALAFAVKRLRLRAVGALVSVENAASLRIFAEAGFRIAGRLEGWWEGANGPEDCLLMQFRPTQSNLT